MAATTKVISIDGDTGKVVDADRVTHVTSKRKGGGAAAGKAGPDLVQWVVIPPPTLAPFIVQFSDPNGSRDPFTAPASPPIPVPAGGSIPAPVAGSPGDYKYTVTDKDGHLTDDPNVIIDS